MREAWDRTEFERKKENKKRVVKQVSPGVGAYGNESI